LVAQKTYRPLGLYKHKAMTYFKDEGMLILKYCSAPCDSKGWYACASGQFSCGAPIPDYCHVSIADCGHARAHKKTALVL